MRPKMTKIERSSRALYELATALYDYEQLFGEAEGLYTFISRMHPAKTHRAEMKARRASADRIADLLCRVSSMIDGVDFLLDRIENGEVVNK